MGLKCGIVGLPNVGKSTIFNALTKAGIGKDTTAPVGQNIWKQIDALDSLISKQQTQLNTFHTDTTQFINSGKDATTNLSGAMTNTTTGGLAALHTARHLGPGRRTVRPACRYPEPNKNHHQQHAGFAAPGGQRCRHRTHRYRHAR